MSIHELPAAVFAELEPNLYLKTFLHKRIRADQSRCDTFRSTRITRGGLQHADTSVTVDLGDTRVLCGTRLEITVPSDERPDEGLIVPNIDLLPMSSPYHKSGPPREDAQCYAHMLVSLFEKKRLVDKRVLLIESGKACWVLYIDLYCLVDAAVSLLLHYRDRVTFDEEAGAVQLDADQSKQTPLQITNLPLAASFGIAELEHILADPRANEQHSLGALILIVGGSHGDDLMLVHHSGHYSIQQAMLEQTMALAKKRFAELRRLLRPT